ncbi:MAG: DUF4013 domain-containing protein [Anaerolineales bacterium]|nr:DUF4013 domain-containing protein [Anaerolineales bacterium]
MKAVIGSALAFANYILPLIPSIPLLGYAGQITRRVTTSDEDPSLGEWDDWGRFFSEGLKIVGAVFLYELPALLLVALSVTLMVLGVFLPLESSSEDALFLAFMLIYLAGLFLFYFGLVLTFVLAIFMAPALAHMLYTGEFRSAFAIREWWPIFKANWVGFALAPVLVYTLNILITMIGYLLYFSIILCFAFPFLAAFGIYLTITIYFALIAVAYRDSLAKNGQLADKIVSP